MPDLPGMAGWDLEAVQEAMEDAGLRPGAGRIWVDAFHEVGLSFGPDGIRVGRLDVTWPSPVAPEHVIRDAVALPPADFPDGLIEAVAEARVRYRGALVACDWCGREMAPGHTERHDGRRICHACMTARFAAIF